MEKGLRTSVFAICLIVLFHVQAVAYTTNEIVSVTHNAVIKSNSQSQNSELNIIFSAQFLKRGWHLNKESSYSPFKIDSVCGLTYLESSNKTIGFSIDNPDNWYISGEYTYSICSGNICLLPEKVHFSYSDKDIGNIQQEQTTQNSQNRLILLLISIGAGLLAVLTPCIWPLIPTVISLFSKKNGQYDPALLSLLFGASIIVIYVAAGLVLTIAFGPSTLNAMSTGAVFNLVFFAVFIMFALSMFGLFEFRLPSSWGDSTDALAHGRAIWSIFFMALTIVIVSFSCTSPIVGGLLVESSRGGLWNACIGMLGFSIGMAAPFTLAALFPEWLEKRPKSGIWMEKIKVCIGFIELAFALKFLSVADMSYGWGILPRKLYISIWILLAVLMGLYLSGVFTKRKTGHWSVIGAIFSFSLGAAMIPGYFGAPLKMISGFLPAADAETVLQPDFTHYFDALDAAEKDNKKVLIYFTGYGCGNCRKMEATLWTNNKVMKEIEDNFVLTVFHVDDKTSNGLFQPETDRLIKTFNLDYSKIRTWGDLWSQFESTRFSSNAQPYYIILDSEGEIVSEPYSGYRPSPKKFIEWLHKTL